MALDLARRVLLGAEPGRAFVYAPAGRRHGHEAVHRRGPRRRRARGRRRRPSRTSARGSSGERPGFHARRAAGSRPGNLHLTLHFLGEVDESRAARARGGPRARAGARRPADWPCRLGRVPAARTGSRHLAGHDGGSRHRWRRRTPCSAADCGLPGLTPESRPFSPHLTVGRVKVPLGWRIGTASRPPCRPAPVCEWDRRGRARCSTATCLRRARRTGALLQHSLRRRRPAAAPADAGGGDSVASDIAILGAGSWGTALAVHLARIGHASASGRSRRPIIAEMRAPARQRGVPAGRRAARGRRCRRRDHRRRRSTASSIVVVGGPVARDAAASPAAAPSAAARRARSLVSAAKGLELDTLQRMSEVLAQETGGAHPVVVLSGPSFAVEVARELPTARLRGVRRTSRPPSACRRSSAGGSSGSTRRPTSSASRSAAR